MFFRGCIGFCVSVLSYLYMMFFRGCIIISASYLYMMSSYLHHIWIWCSFGDVLVSVYRFCVCVRNINVGIRNSDILFFGVCIGSCVSVPGIYKKHIYTFKEYSYKILSWVNWFLCIGSVYVWGIHMYMQGIHTDIIFFRGCVGSWRATATVNP